MLRIQTLLRPALAGVFALTLLVPAATQAAARPNRDRAKVLLAQGQDHYRAGRFELAIKLFLEAYAVDPDPAIQFNVGRAYEELGRADDAIKAYELCLRGSPAPDVARRAKGNLEYLRARGGRGRLAVVVDADGADIAVDGRLLGRSPMSPLELPPGKHTVRVAAAGRPTVERDIEVVDGTETVLQVSLARGTAVVPGAGSETDTPVQRPTAFVVDEPKPRIHPAAWATLGSGAALLITGGILAGIAEANRDEVRDAMRKIQNGYIAGITRKDAVLRRDKANQEMTAGVVLMSIGGAALAASIPLFFLNRGGAGGAGGASDEAPASEEEPTSGGWGDQTSLSATPVDGGGYFSVQGRF